MEFIVQTLKTDLDLILKEYLPELSRSQLVKYIKTGKVMINDVIADKRNIVVYKDDKIIIDLQNYKEDDTFTKKLGDLNIIFEDEDLLVLDKPIGISVHPGTGNKTDTLLNIVYNYVGVNLEEIKFINRLDFGTSGIVFVAKNKYSHSYYSSQFEKRNVKKEYICVVDRKFRTILAEHEMMSVEGIINRAVSDRKKMQVYEYKLIPSIFTPTELNFRLKSFQKDYKKSGRYVLTEFRIADLDSDDDMELDLSVESKKEMFSKIDEIEKIRMHNDNLVDESKDENMNIGDGVKDVTDFDKSEFILISANLRTGRTHQIRATLKTLGFPVLGDDTYRGTKYDRVMLHSHKSGIILKNGEYRVFTSSIPSDFLQFLVENEDI